MMCPPPEDSKETESSFEKLELAEVLLVCSSQCDSFTYDKFKSNKTVMPVYTPL